MGNNNLNSKGKEKSYASDLIQKIDEFKEKERLIKTSNNIEKRGNSIGLAFRLSTELVSGIVVGSVMGWSLDKWLGSQPWFFLIFFEVSSQMRQPMHF